MEPGYLIVVNAPRVYPIDPDAFGAVEAWWELLKRIHPGGPQGCCGEGSEFENEVFEMHPFWWGDCTCGRDDRVAARLVGGSHSDDCVNHRVRAKYEEIKDMPFESRVEALQVYLAEVGIPYEGCMLVCDCGWQEEMEAAEAAENHREGCKGARPNFKHKPTGYWMAWYQHPFRYANQSHALDVAGFEAIVKDCLASLTESR